MKRTLLALLILVTALAACGRDGEGQEEGQAEVLVLAAFDQSSYLRRQVELYNQSQDDFQIEIHNTKGLRYRRKTACSGCSGKSCRETGRT